MSKGKDEGRKAVTRRGSSFTNVLESQLHRSREMNNGERKAKIVLCKIQRRCEGEAVSFRAREGYNTASVYGKKGTMNKIQKKKTLK